MIISVTSFSIPDGPNASHRSSSVFSSSIIFNIPPVISRLFWVIKIKVLYYAMPTPSTAKAESVSETLCRFDRSGEPVIVIRLFCNTVKIYIFIRTAFHTLPPSLMKAARALEVRTISSQSIISFGVCMFARGMLITAHGMPPF